MLEKHSCLKDQEYSSVSSPKLIHASSKEPNDYDTATSSFITTQARATPISKSITYCISTSEMIHVISELPSMESPSFHNAGKLKYQPNILSSYTTDHSSTISDHTSTTGDSEVSSHELGEVVPLCDVIHCVVLH